MKSFYFHLFIIFFFYETYNQIRNTFLYLVLPSEKALGGSLFVYDFSSFFFLPFLFQKNNFSKFSVNLVKGDSSFTPQIRFSRKSMVVGSISLLYDFFRLPIIRLVRVMSCLNSSNKV